jgi:hypothetical protein
MSRLFVAPFLFRMVAHQLDTASAGPAGHLIHVDNRDENIARDIFNALESRAARHQPV